MTYSGHTIKLARENKGMTQQEFAKSMGVHVQFISNIERGTALIPPKKVKKAAKVLGVWMKTIVDDLRKDWMNTLDKRLGLK